MKFHMLLSMGLILSLSACDNLSNPADLQRSTLENPTREKAAQAKTVRPQAGQAQRLIDTELLPDLRKSLSDQAKTWHRGTQAYLKSLKCLEKTQKQNKNNQDNHPCQPPKQRDFMAASQKPTS